MEKLKNLIDRSGNIIWYDFVVKFHEKIILFTWLTFWFDDTTFSVNSTNTAVILAISLEACGIHPSDSNDKMIKEDFNCVVFKIILFTISPSKCCMPSTVSTYQKTKLHQSLPNSIKYSAFPHEYMPHLTDNLYHLVMCVQISKPGQIHHLALIYSYISSELHFFQISKILRIL